MWFGLFLFLAQFTDSNLMTVLFAYVAHFVVSPIAFVLQRGFVFRHSGGVLHSFLKFQLGYAFPLLMNGPLLLLALQISNGNAALSQGILVVVVAFSSLLINRFLVFRAPNPQRNS